MKLALIGGGVLGRHRVITNAKWGLGKIWCSLHLRTEDSFMSSSMVSGSRQPGMAEADGTRCLSDNALVCGEYWMLVMDMAVLRVEDTYGARNSKGSRCFNMNAPQLFDFLPSYASRTSLYPMVVYLTTFSPTGLRSPSYVSSSSGAARPRHTRASFHPRLEASSTPTFMPRYPSGGKACAASPMRNTRPPAAEYRSALRECTGMTVRNSICCTFVPGTTRLRRSSSSSCEGNWGRRLLSRRVVCSSWPVQRRVVTRHRSLVSAMHDTRWPLAVRQFHLLRLAGMPQRMCASALTYSYGSVLPPNLIPISCRTLLAAPSAPTKYLPRMVLASPLNTSPLPSGKGVPCAQCWMISGVSSMAWTLTLTPIPAVASARVDSGCCLWSEASSECTHRGAFHRWGPIALVRMCSSSSCGITTGNLWWLVWHSSKAKSTAICPLTNSRSPLTSTALSRTSLMIPRRSKISSVLT
mmetsp:Transcript_42882/g.121549  ORF Transcript_42882/g.121549 Transcript_42882/m.121549 type:complete len:468 (-) Transcript_42882:336-1739(-)